MKAGLYATTALILGALATLLGVLRTIGGGYLVGGVELVAGLAALALGCLLLWRSRRPDGRRYLRRTLRVAGAAVAAWFLVLPALAAVGIAHKPRVDVKPADLGRPYQEVTLRASDGVKLAAWYVPSQNGAVVITFPNRSQPVPHARMLVRHGYGVLLLDMRGNGESGGKRNGYGWGSRKDLEAAIDFLAAKHERIGGLGLSVGGEQMLEAAAYDTRLAAVVSEGAGYRTVHEVLETGRSELAELPQDIVAVGLTHLLSSEPSPKPLDELVGRIAPRPVFLIEAGHGMGGEQLNALYYRRAGEPKQHWVIPEARHTRGLQTRPREYERRVVGFFDRYLLQ